MAFCPLGVAVREAVERRGVDIVGECQRRRREGAFADEGWALRGGGGTGLLGDIVKVSHGYAPFLFRMREAS